MVTSGRNKRGGLGELGQIQGMLVAREGHESDKISDLISAIRAVRSDPR